MMYKFLTIALLLSGATALAQTEPPIQVGQWRSHYANASGQCIALAADDDVLVGGESALMQYFDEYKSVEAFDRVSGLSDIDITQVYYDTESDESYIFYKNSNIDVVSKSDVTNLPYILNSPVTSNKTINEVMRSGDYLYLSAGLGIIVLDMPRKEIKETYTIQATGEPEVKSSCIIGNQIYTSTADGIYLGDLSTNLNNYSNWTQAFGAQSPKLLVLNAKLHYFVDSLIISYEGGVHDTVAAMDSSYAVVDAYVQGADMYIIGQNPEYDNKIYKLSAGNISEVIFNDRVFRPNGIVVSPSGIIYISDYWRGLCRIESGNFTLHVPSGPNTNSFYDIYFSDHVMYCPSGSVDLAYNGRYNRDGLKIFADDKWSFVNEKNNPSLFSFLDMMCVARDPNSGSVYVGSWGGGLLELRSDGSQEIYNDGFFTTMFGGARITSMVMDESNNLWMTNFGNSMKGLNCKDAEGNFINYNYNKGIGLGPITIDQAGQLWMIEPASGALHCYDPAGTIDDVSDDRQSGFISGLSGGARCMEVTQDGELWIGTDNGISIIPCPESYIGGNCAVELRVVNYDGIINGYLFNDQIINTICVDGANRKWIGTENGAWLITEDAEQILLNFDKSNSPLPTSAVKCISVNPDNGEVFFATEAGLISYRGDATQGIDENKNSLLVFPNPVQPSYSGNIAIRGVPTNAQVRITDAKGQLVYQTQAEGGQANWNGYTYTGKKAHSGVYIVYALSADGQLRTSTKFVIME